MPGPRRHSAKWDRCVREVKRRGTAADPYAVCTAALGELSRRKRASKKGTRVTNPVRDPAHKKILRVLAHHFASDEADLRRKAKKRR